MFLWLLCLPREPLRDRRSIRSFRDQDTKSIFEQRKVQRFRSVDRIALRRLVQVDCAEQLRDLASHSTNQLEAINGNTSAGSACAEYSVRIDEQYRVRFRWQDGDAFDVEIANAN